MNHALWARAGARVIAALFVVGGVAACDRNSEVRQTATPDPSAVVVGVAPAAPQGDTPQTTPASKPQNELSKTDETKNMPLEGQDNSHLTEAKKDSQRAGSGSDAQTQRRTQ